MKSANNIGPNGCSQIGLHYMSESFVTNDMLFQNDFEWYSFTARRYATDIDRRNVLST